MILQIKKLILLAIFSLTPILLPVSASAINCGASDLSAQDAISCGANGASGSDQTVSNAGTNIDSTIAKFVNLFSVIIGVIAVIMIIIGGFRYITSSGNAEKVSQAKNTIIYALIGLVVVALAQVMANFVLDKATQTDKNMPQDSSTPSGRTGGGRGDRPN